MDELLLFPNSNMGAPSSPLDKTEFGETSQPSSDLSSHVMQNCICFGRNWSGILPQKTTTDQGSIAYQQ
eukprot:11623695-Prorocentrum_lima.AAC.1